MEYLDWTSGAWKPNGCIFCGREDLLRGADGLLRCPDCDFKGDRPMQSQFCYGCLENWITLRDGRTFREEPHACPKPQPSFGVCVG